MPPLEPGLVFRISEVAARYRWDVFFVTQRPATAGEAVQRQTQRWLTPQGFELPAVLVLRGSRGKLAGALQLDFLVDDTPHHCVDVVSESNARAVFILRHDDPTATQSAKRLGIEVIPSVAESLDLLEMEQEARVKPTLLKRIAKKVGWERPS